MSQVATQTFTDITIAGLQSMPSTALDELSFGVIGFDPDTAVVVYNATESRLAGLPAESVMGEPYFLSVAQCMNNYMIAQRFEDEPHLDVVMDYVLTLRMRPTPVKLRLLKEASCPVRYVLVQR